MTNKQCCCQDLFLDLETKRGMATLPEGNQELLVARDKVETWTKWTRVHLSFETMVSTSQHWLHQFQLLTEHSLKGAKITVILLQAQAPSMLSWDRDLGHQVSRPRPGQNELDCTRVSRSQHC